MSESGLERWGKAITRFEKLDTLLKLALEMQARRLGISLTEIERLYGVSRRTAQRMKDAICRVFPQVEDREDESRVRYWRLPAGTLDRMAGSTAEELADLEKAIALLKRENMHDQAERLAGLEAKLRAVMRPETARRVEPDLEALLEAEGIAMRAGPRPRIVPQVIGDLRQAVLTCRQVVLHYRKPDTKAVVRRQVHPYGFLNGHRHYLVAFNPNPAVDRMALFRLANIQKVELLEAAFGRDPGFSLQAYAERSFGVWQEEPFDVAWRFHGDAADAAAEYLFHPTQTQERQADGSLIVRFKAGGLLEMAWHLYAWGNKVEVLVPAKLAALCRDTQKSWPALP